MKASEVLKKYRKGERNFVGLNLAGQSFKGECLAGAQFIKVNIRGTDFSNADLSNTKFMEAEGGLQRYWVIFLLFVIGLLSGLAGFCCGSAFYWVGKIISPSLKINTSVIQELGLNFNQNYSSIITGLLGLLLLVVFFVVALWRGIATSFSVVAIILAVAVAIVVPFFFALTSSRYTFTFGSLSFQQIMTIFLVAPSIVSVAALVAFTIEGIVLFMVAYASASLISSIGNIVCILAFAVCFAGAFEVFVSISMMSLSPIGSVAFPKTLITETLIPFTIALTWFGIYLGRRALKKENKDAWVHPIAIRFATMNSTNFFGANLTDADFIGANLKNTDLRKANITRVNWRNVKRLNFACLGDSYLNDPRLRRLIIGKEVIHKNFDYQNLQGVNLNGVNLRNASFINANLREVSLRKSDLTNANLTGAKLERAVLENTIFKQANLTSADLSKAIATNSDFSQSLLVRSNLESTNLTGAHFTGACIQDWIVSRNTKLDEVKCKYIYLKFVDGDKLDQVPQKGEFKNLEFIFFVRSILDTLDLYHDNNINPRVAVIVLRSLANDYREHLEVVGLEKKGKGIIIKLKTSEFTNHEQLKQEYYHRYDNALNLFMTDPQKILPSYETLETTVTELVEDIKQRPNTSIKYLFNGGLFITGGEQKMNINQRGNFGVGVNQGKIRVEKLAGTLNEAQQKSIAEVAIEIQQLLEGLSQTYPTETFSQKAVVAEEAIQHIEDNPTLKRRLVNVIKAMGIEALIEAINHPVANVLRAGIESFRET